MAMASNRKKGDYSVLSEVNTEEEWNTLLERKVSMLSLTTIKVTFVVTDGSVFDRCNLDG